MQIAQHADRSEKLTGLRGEEIHQWIDGFFNRESFEEFQRVGRRPDYDPYTHRKYRHCAEALDDAYKIFDSRYTHEQIKAIFESHIRDDYQGYMPCLADFENGTFTEKYHEAEAGGDLEAILSEAELSEYFKGKSYTKKRGPQLSTGFYWRIVWPTAIAALLFAVSSFVLIVPLFRRNMMEQKRFLIRELTQTAASAISFYIHQAETGVMSRDKAQAEAAAELAQLRYGDDGKAYFWITDMHPTMIMHPYRPDLIGQDLTHYTEPEDPSHKKLFSEFTQQVKLHGEGYLEYNWHRKDDPSQPVPKLSYVLGLPEWDWIIGTGIYIHDVEAEMERLTRHLLLTDGIISLALFILLGNLIFQSRRIEQNRAQAEHGLREAKDRYRALVEASGEGYLLEVEGQTVFSNHTLRTMTGYSEKELTTRAPMDLLAPGIDTNLFAANHLRQLYEGTSSAAEFEAVLQTKQGEKRNVWLSTSRIFFSKKQGHVLLFNPLSRGSEETLRGFHSASPSNTLPLNELQPHIEQSQTAGEVVHRLKELPAQLRTLIDQGIRPQFLRTLIGETCDSAIRRFIELYLDARPAPTPFAFLSLGSNARHDMTLFSDQDNALIFSDVPADQLTATRQRFLRLGDEVCGRLQQAGYPYCPGGIMAANPTWCLSLSEWKVRFKTWILEATPQSILDVNVFLDIRCGFGDEPLVAELKQYIQSLTEQNPEFFMHYARNCLRYQAPLTLFGHLKTHRHDGKKSINIKENIRPIETFARIYALKHTLSEVGTLERIQKLQALGILQEQTRREMVEILNLLWQLRFDHQLTTENLSIHDELEIETLTDLERQHLQNALSKISTFQTKLSYDFLGVDGR